MDPSQVDSQVNSLSYLIPTGESDIAVRDVLIPIFGDAIACKVPGMACGTQTINDPGALTAVIFSTFNAATLIFVTILLTFILLMIFVKTAQDGEFMGKSWNTTFSALRMMAGIAFLLPMPNQFSTVQNFVLYTGLWSSGMANAANLAISDHYLKRLQNNMLAQNSGAISVRNEAQYLMSMHLCAAIANTKPLAKVAMQSKPIGFFQGLTNGGGLEHAYVETGFYFIPTYAPCGRLIVKPYEKITAKSALPTTDIWNPGLNKEPLTASARRKMEATADDIAVRSRLVRLAAIDSLRSEQGPLRALANEIAKKYEASQIKYDPETGAVTKAGEISKDGSIMSEEESLEFVNKFASILRAADTKLNSDLDKVRTEFMESTNAEGGFLSDARKLLQEGGWMSAAATYRTMLDMVSFQFSGADQNPIRFEEHDIQELRYMTGRFGVYEDLIATRSFLEKTLGSDAGIAQIASAMGTAGKSVVTPSSINSTSIEKIVKSKGALGDAMDALYGSQYLNGMRDMVIKSMAINPSENADPLLQIKNIGDLATATAGGIQGTQFTALGIIGFLEASNGVLKIKSWILDTKNLADGAKSILTPIFTIMSAVSTALLGIGYAFSTWIPALPFISFLLAQLGWLFGLVMTLFAVNIWAVLHTTPARSDSFIGSDAQGYLLITSVFFRPILAISGLSMSYIIAPPAVKLVNLTLLPMMVASNVSSNTLSVLIATIFGLVLYFIIIKAVLTMVFMLPQSFPDEVMRVISASTGDLGQSKALGTMEASEGSSRVGTQTMQGVLQSQKDHLDAKIAERKERAKKEEEDAKAAAVQDSAKNVGGAGNQPGSEAPSKVHRGPTE